MIKICRTRAVLSFAARVVILTVMPFSIAVAAGNDCGAIVDITAGQADSESIWTNGFHVKTNVLASSGRFDYKFIIDGKPSTRSTTSWNASDGEDFFVIDHVPCNHCEITDVSVDVDSIICTVISSR